MLPITSPICVNHHRRRNRVRHSDYDLKDIREEGEPVTGPASRPRCQTNFTHTSFTHFSHALHWVSCIHTLLHTQASNHSNASHSSLTFCRLVNPHSCSIHTPLAKVTSQTFEHDCNILHSLFYWQGRAQGKNGFFFYAGDFCPLFALVWLGLWCDYVNKYQICPFWSCWFSHKCLLPWVNFHVQVDDKAILWILGLSLIFSLPQSVMCKQWERWLWRNTVTMVKGIMGEGVVINSSFLCCTLISSREFQHGPSK